MSRPKPHPVKPHTPGWPVRYQYGAGCQGCGIGRYRPHTLRCGCVVLYCQSCGDHPEPNHESHRGTR